MPVLCPCHMFSVLCVCTLWLYSVSVLCFSISVLCLFSHIPVHIFCVSFLSWFSLQILNYLQSVTDLLWLFYMYYLPNSIWSLLMLFLLRYKAAQFPILCIFIIYDNSRCWFFNGCRVIKATKHLWMQRCGCVLCENCIINLQQLKPSKCATQVILCDKHLLHWSCLSIHRWCWSRGYWPILLMQWSTDIERRWWLKRVRQPL